MHLVRPKSSMSVCGKCYLSGEIVPEHEIVGLCILALPRGNAPVRKGFSTFRCVVLDFFRLKFLFISSVQLLRILSNKNLFLFYNCWWGRAPVARGSLFIIYLICLFFLIPHISLTTLRCMFLIRPLQLGAKNCN